MKLHQVHWIRIATLLLSTPIVFASSRWEGQPCGNSFTYNEPVSSLAAEARGSGSVTMLSDTTFRLTDFKGCSVTITGIADGLSADGAGQPASSSSIAVNNLIRSNVFTQAKPRSETESNTPSQQQEGPEHAAPGVRVDVAPDAPADPQPGGLRRTFSRANSGNADVFYNRWEVFGEDGSTFGINPSVSWGEEADIIVTLPIHLVSPPSGSNVFAVGLDGLYKKPLAGSIENLEGGGHLYTMAFFGDDSAINIGGGPFLSWSKRFKDDWIVSLGTLLEFTFPHNGDTTVELVPGVNLGYTIKQDMAANIFAIHYINLEGADNAGDYTDIGTDFAFVRGGWSLRVGAKTTVGLDDVKSTEVFLGSQWFF